MELTEADVARFMGKIKRAGPDECWLWTGSIDSHGYGYFSLRPRRMRLSHRIAFALEVGPIPAGMCVCHHCDTPRCCNPRHLFLGTLSDNNADMKAKGRYRIPPPRRGDANHNSKLSNAQRIELCALYHSGASRLELARKFGITYGQVWKIATKQCPMRGPEEDK